jgi:2-hydroxy-3-oxopropionate reductase
VARIAFIGLGIMGGPMAVNLQRAGHEVVGYNRTAGKADPLIEAGGSEANSVAATVAAAEIVAVMVPDTPDVEQVLLGDDGQPGVFELAEPGSLVIDFSTIRPDATRRLAKLAADKNLQILDAPVSGGQAGAEAGTLSIMVGGSAHDFDRARPVLQAVGHTIVHVGDHGAGQTVKTANQLIVAANIEALAEALVLLSAYDIDLDSALDVLGGGLAGSAVLTQKRGNMLGHDFTPGFRTALHLKDLGILTAAARAAGVAIPVGALVTELMSSAKANGDGALDHSALLHGVERLAGRHPA